MTKQVKLIAVLVLLIAASVYPVSASYPKLTGYVNDFAGLLTPQEEAALAEQAGMVEHNTTVQIAIVTIQTTNGEDTILWGAHTGTQNGVGQKATDNGVVIVYSVADGGGIATGRGIESTLTDYFINNIGRNAHPYFEQKKYYAGLSFLISEIDKKVEPGNVTAPVAQGPKDIPNTGAILVGGLIAMMLVMVAAFLISRVFREEIVSSSHEDEDDDHLTHAATAVALGSILVDRHHHHDDDDDSFNSGFSWSSGGHSGGGGFGGFGGGGFGGGGGHF